MFLLCFGRLRNGPFEGPATVKPSALPVDIYSSYKHCDRLSGVDMNIARFHRFAGYCARSMVELGPIPTVKWMFATVQLNLGLSRPGHVSVRGPLLRYPLRLRARSSDPQIFRQIMIEDEYRVLAGLSIKHIIDLGANVGIASAYFLSRFPKAKVLAVEPDPETVEACRINLAPYDGRVQVLHGAAWSKRTVLMLQRRTCAANTTVNENVRTESDRIAIEGWDIGSLIALSGFDSIDLLKIDIEGAERYIFSDESREWLRLVKNISIELHGDSCRKAFYSALAGYEYENLRSGELDICLNVRPRVQMSSIDMGMQELPER
jgi:FkbM family methyltransferase